MTAYPAGASPERCDRPMAQFSLTKLSDLATVGMVLLVAVDCPEPAVTPGIWERVGSRDGWTFCSHLVADAGERYAVLCGQHSEHRIIWGFMTRLDHA